MVSLQFDLKGEIRRFELAEGEHPVGRAPQNDLHLGIATVSRRHAILRVAGERVYVRDLESAGGTWLDDQRIGADEVEVPPGRFLRFADVLAWHGDHPQPQRTISGNVFAPETEISSGISYRLSDGFSEAARSRMMAMMGDLFELLASSDDVKIGKKACHFVSLLVRADRVVLLEDDGPGTLIREKERWTRYEERDPTLRVSQTLVEMVMGKQTGLVVRDARIDPATKDSPSIHDLDIRSAMVAPLFDNERVRGVLYVDTRGVTVAYTDEDIQVLTATANAVALKLKDSDDSAEKKAAIRVQQRMLPEELPSIDGYELVAFQEMCRGVGGDLYDCLRRPNGNFLLVLGDVSGKGIPAALAMGACVVLLRALAESNLGLEELLKRLNQHLMRTLPEGQFVTLFLGELDPGSGRMLYVNAGHEYPALSSPGDEMVYLTSTAFPVGWFEAYEPEQREIELPPGGFLTIFSDGVSEATIDGEHQLGREAVDEILREHGGEELSRMVERITNLVKTYLAGHGASDDLTLMLLRRDPGSAGEL